MEKKSASEEDISSELGNKMVLLKKNVGIELPSRTLVKLAKEIEEDVNRRKKNLILL